MIQVDDKVFRGPRPQSVHDIVGIKSLIDLESGFYDFTHPKEHKKYLELEKLVQEFSNVKMGDVFPPTELELQQCQLLMVAGPHPVYVHCRFGNDRTGLVCAYYRVKVNGWKVDKAIQEMFDLGFHKFPYSYLGWVRALRGYIG